MATYAAGRGLLTMQAQPFDTNARGWPDGALHFGRAELGGALVAGARPPRHLCDLLHFACTFWPEDRVRTDYADYKDDNVGIAYEAQRLAPPILTLGKSPVSILGAKPRASSVATSYARLSTTTGACSTGKLTDRAMKQFLWAISCKASALSRSEPTASVT